MSMTPSEDVLLRTTGHLMSVEAMQAVIWAGFALCFVGFCARSYIRWLCFRRLLPEDWIMLAALAIQLAAACIAQLRLPYVYMLEDVSNRSIPMPPTFLDDVPKALHGIFIQGILSITGVHAVKLSFLLFFRRLGRQMPKYMVFWWFVAFVTLASYAVSIALVEYKCMLSSLDVIFFECTANGETARQWTYMIAYCTIDAASDVLILFLPVVILWQVRLTIRKKLVLAAIFSLTLVTVAVTIIRGSIHEGKVATDGSQTQNIAWAWFWLSIEFITAYITSCLVSFRMLFVHNEKYSNAHVRAQQAALHDNKHRQLANSPPYHRHTSVFKNSDSSRRRLFLDTLFDTFHEWEGTTRHGRNDGARFLGDAAMPSGRMSVDFMRYEPRGSDGSSRDGLVSFTDWPMPVGRSSSSRSGCSSNSSSTGRPDSTRTLVAAGQDRHVSELVLKPGDVVVGDREANWPLRS